MYIEKAYIDYNVRFTTKNINIFQVIRIRKKHKGVTALIWVTNRPYLSIKGHLEQGKSMILFFLN